MVELVRTMPPPGHPDAPADVIKPPPLDMDALSARSTTPTVSDVEPTRAIAAAQMQIW
jgi:hypothetical protein